ncbi:MAG TPA: hypothetical protein VFC85_01530, partial [Verrucomicrobiae bacterium]|nr:hypothetical protein [Verrucomicrobiae bacterium]
MITNIKNTTEAGLGAKPNKIKEMDFIQVLNLLESLTARYNKLAAAAKDAFSRSNGDDPAMQIIASELDEQGQLQKRESAQHT